jgi:hypothetical protein
MTFKGVKFIQQLNKTFIHGGYFRAVVVVWKGNDEAPRHCFDVVLLPMAIVASC